MKIYTNFEIEGIYRLNILKILSIKWIKSGVESKNAWKFLLNVDVFEHVPTGQFP